MVIPRTSGNIRRCGGLMIELAVAIMLLLVALLPLAYSIATEARTARAHYYRAVAIEIVDGEMETLLAGEWRAFRSGKHEYATRARAATNLPPGQFLLTVESTTLRLEWQPEGIRRGGPVVRQGPLP